MIHAKDMTCFLLMDARQHKLFWHVGYSGMSGRRSARRASAGAKPPSAIIAQEESQFPHEAAPQQSGSRELRVANPAPPWYIDGFPLVQEPYESLLNVDEVIAAVGEEGSVHRSRPSPFSHASGSVAKVLDEFSQRVRLAIGVRSDHHTTIAGLGVLSFVLLHLNRVCGFMLAEHKGSAVEKRVLLCTCGAGVARGTDVP
jgi:hypothetical protein